MPTTTPTTTPMIVSRKSGLFVAEANGEMRRLCDRVVANRLIYDEGDGIYRTEFDFKTIRGNRLRLILDRAEAGEQKKLASALLNAGFALPAKPDRDVILKHLTAARPSGRHPRAPDWLS